MFLFIPSIESSGSACYLILGKGTNLRMYSGFREVIIFGDETKQPQIDDAFVVFSRSPLFAFWLW